MMFAAFVLSIIAVAAAGLSAWYTRRQAVVAEEVRRIEELGGTAHFQALRHRPARTGR